MKILLNGTDVSAWYVGQSLSGQKITGSERDNFDLKLISYVGGQAIPVQPAGEQDCQVWDDAQTLLIFRGRVVRPSGVTVGNDPVAGYVTVWSIHCLGLTRDLDRKVAQQSYAAKTTGFIFRDLIQRYTQGFSDALVTTGGNVLQDFNTRQQKITQVFDTLAGIQGWEWYDDYQGNVHFQPPGVEVSPIPTVTDANVDSLCGTSLTVEPDTTNLANVIKLFYRTFVGQLVPGGYTDGTTVSVSNAVDQITGIGTKWSSTVTPGSSFQIQGSTSSYRVKAVVNDTTITLDQNYAEATASSQPYFITDIPMALRRSDAGSISVMAALRGDDGIFEKAVRTNNVYSFAEAEQYAQDELLSYANALVNVGFPIISDQVPGDIRAGQSVSFNLTARYSLQATLPIKQVSVKDLGGITSTGFPLLQYQVSFETRLYSLAKMMQAIGRSVDAKTNTTQEQLVADVLGASETATVAETTRIVTYGSGPYVWGPSVRAINLTSDGTTANAVIVSSNLELASSATAGSWTSNWLPCYDPPSLKTFAHAETIPAGCAVTYQFRSAQDTTGTQASAWYTAIASVPWQNYLQIQITMTSGSAGTTPVVDPPSYSPDKPVLHWGRGTWGKVSQVTDTQAGWQTWTLSGVDATTTPGSIQLAQSGGIYVASGTAASPWMANHSMPVNKVASETSTTPTGTALAYQYRSSPDGTDASAGPWNSSLQAIAQASYIQTQIALSTSSPAVTPQVSGFSLSPE